jgi:hypothetical protein
MIATEGLLRDAIQMFQDMIAKLAEAHAQANGGDPEAETSSAATTPVAIDIPPPLATESSSRPPPSLILFSTSLAALTPAASVLSTARS